jgi:transposase-like protein
MRKRSLKRYGAAFKARVAVTALQESQTLAQVGHRFGVHLVLVGQLLNFHRSLPRQAIGARKAAFSRSQH